MKHKLCSLCGFITRNKRKWILRNNGLRLCRYCREDYILQAKTPTSQFTLLPDGEYSPHIPKIEKRALIHLEKPRVRTGITSFSPRKKSEETISGGLGLAPLQSVPSAAPKTITLKAVEGVQKPKVVKGHEVTLANNE